MASIPRDPAPEGTPALLREGYDFIGRRCRRYRSDVFETRLLLRPTVCMTGEQAARLFYDNDRFRRDGAAPRRIRRTLFGEGGVQGLDGEAHRSRKRMFLSLMTPEAIDRLTAIFADRWRERIPAWERVERVPLHEEQQRVLCRAVFDWAGIPLPEPVVPDRTRDLAEMVTGAGAIGPAHWRGRRARGRAERWAEQMVDGLRAGRLWAPEDSALHVVARHREPDGTLLDRHTAAVELLNLLRPTVAVARFIVFTALAMHQYPGARERLFAEGGEYRELFVQEVRRFYPFFPFVPALVREGFEWHGYRFPAGRRVLLDLYGTNHDPRLWTEPEIFRPERFRDWDGSPYGFIPQGGGDHERHHRCPGEWVTIALMKEALRLLTRSIRYEVPAQDLHLEPARIPTLPRSGFVIGGVRRR